ncbi:MAG: MBL fold metallo-hydrolase [Candidatus Pacebacteria bacterium]|nr:MBL fold metallo-hydrolase [Candidatus Paceibacterota bacterium]
MKVSFHGACREVTGSCILVETSDVKFIVDCGLFQDEDSEFRNMISFDFNPFDIDFVLLTHAHVDHCGKIPKLFKEGFMGNVYCSYPTVDLANQMLLDSAKVFTMREGGTPLYFPSDVEKAIENFKAVPYDQEYSITNNIRIRLKDAGHILGSAIFEVWIREGKREVKLVFSGDLGNPPAPIVKDTDLIDGADYVFIESTYGDKVHLSRDNGRKLLEEKIIEGIKNDAVMIMPVFALERTQEMIVELKRIFEKGHIKNIPVFLDSPLASRVTNVYKKYESFFDEEAKRISKKKKDLFYFENFKISKKKGDQASFLKHSGAKFVMAGSGMCDGGRVLDYLKKYLPKKNTELLIISYQAENSLGRKLMEGESEVDIGKKRVRVRANVSKIQAFSSHADSLKLVDWIGEIKKPNPKTIFINHGDGISSEVLSNNIKEKFDLNTLIPDYGEEYEL